MHKSKARTMPSVTEQNLGQPMESTSKGWPLFSLLKANKYFYLKKKRGL